MISNRHFGNLGIQTSPCAAALDSHEVAPISGDAEKSGIEVADA
jgi:hypothetical protein